MVVALGPGRFYGSSLPRPRFFPDPKLNSTRVDPPESVMDPFLSWANDAHWSMGGLSFRRLRLQGRIEGSISKLRNLSPKRRKTSTRFTKQRLASLDEEDDEPETDEEVYDEVYDSGSEEEVEKEGDDEEEEEESEEEEIVVSSKKRKRVRRLGDEFDRIAEEARKKEKESKKVSKRGKGMEKETEKPRRVSPRKKMNLGVA